MFVTVDFANLVHVLPVEDLVGHETDVGCACGPRVDVHTINGGVVVLHRSLDAREELG